MAELCNTIDIPLFKIYPWNESAAVDGGTIDPWSAVGTFAGGTFSPWNAGYSADGGTSGYHEPNLDIVGSF